MATSIVPAKNKSTKHAWRLLACMGLLAAIVMPIPVSWRDHGFGDLVGNCIHIPVFAGITLLIDQLVEHRSNGTRYWMRCPLLAVLLAVLSEWLQSFTGRSPSLLDLCANLSGILLATIVIVRRSLPTRRVLLLAVACGGMVMGWLACAPLIDQLIHIHAKKKIFPELLVYDHPGALWNPQGATQLRIVQIEGGRQGLEVSMEAGSYEGMYYIVPRSLDTSNTAGLILEIQSHAEPFELGVRIDDQDGYRTYRSLLVTKGRCLHRLEWLTHDQSDISRICLFTGESQPARTYRLLDARVIRSPLGLGEPGRP